MIRRSGDIREIKMFGTEALRQAVKEDMRRRLPEQKITQTRKLSTLIATLLQEQHVNFMALELKPNQGLESVEET